MDENIFVFVPNIIGYTRIILALISCYFMPTDYVTATSCYILSAFLDVFDGYAARWLNQSTKFGAMLDQLTDRCTTMCLLVVLSYFYPAYIFWFQLSMALDIAGHWIHLHATVMQGKTSHKFIDASENPLMRLYYTSKPVLFTMCAGNELFYSMLYLVYFTEGPRIPLIGVGLFRLTALISFPIAIVKSAISGLHMVLASYNLAIIDVAERKKLKLAKKE
uniref:CDP-diacylglycerol--inositol 3-phosphatidyltransferase n=1 Tax=Strigamia maritima TaxID=126957 RepID=T1J2Q7_STRMM